MTAEIELAWDARDLAHHAMIRGFGDLVTALCYLRFQWRRNADDREQAVRRVAIDVLLEDATDAERTCWRAISSNDDVQTFEQAVAAQVAFLSTYLDRIRAAA